MCSTQLLGRGKLCTVSESDIDDIKNKYRYEYCGYAFQNEDHTNFAFSNEVEGITVNITMYAAINSSTEQPDEAFSFLNVLFSDEIQSGDGFFIGDHVYGSAFMCPEGIPVNDHALQNTYRWISKNDRDAIQSINSRINAARYGADLEKILLK